MQVLRTPDERFADLPDFDYEPQYAEIPDGDGGSLRMAYVEAGPPDGEPVLLLHGEPSWSFLYRHVMAELAAAGLRAVAPDLVGFGRSDKPTELSDYTYARHVEWVRAFAFDALDLRGVTLVGQDWGGLIGLRLVAENPDRWARVVLANTVLPTGDQKMPPAWLAFRDTVKKVPKFDVARSVQAGCTSTLSPEVRAAYDAPFPGEEYKAAARAFPGLVPVTPDDPATEANRAAWQKLSTMDTPVLCAFSDKDPIMSPLAPIMQAGLPGAKGREHPTIAGAGHFLQEDAGAELGQAIVQFVQST
jgi:haloalkane dehalogenase